MQATLDVSIHHFEKKSGLLYLLELRPEHNITFGIFLAVSNISSSVSILVVYDAWSLRGVDE